MLYSVLHDLLFWLLACVGTPALCAVLLKVFQNKLPRDKGREFAVDGEKSAGKIRGAGLVFICSLLDIECRLLIVYQLQSFAYVFQADSVRLSLWGFVATVDH